MKIPAEFDEIRPYTPEELPAVFDELLADPQFLPIALSFFPGATREQLRAQLALCPGETVWDVGAGTGSGLFPSAGPCW